jgi:hypothetical protein
MASSGRIVGMGSTSEPPKVAGEARGTSVPPALAAAAPRIPRAEDISELKAAAQLQPEGHHNLEFDIALVGLVVAAISWVLVPTLPVKVAVIAFGAGILAYMAYRSHFTRKVSKLCKHVIAVSCILLVLVGGGWQVLSQWKDQHPDGSITNSLANPPGVTVQPGRSDAKQERGNAGSKELESGTTRQLKDEVARMLGTQKKAEGENPQNEASYPSAASTAPVGGQLSSNPSSWRQLCSSKLSAEDAESAIGKALQQGKLSYAECLLLNLGTSSAKLDECEHLYSYALKNAKFSDAVRIVDVCWDGRLHQEKIEEIEHEKLKQQ